MSLIDIFTGIGVLKVEFISAKFAHFMRHIWIGILTTLHILPVIMLGGLNVAIVKKLHNNQSERKKMGSTSTGKFTCKMLMFTLKSRATVKLCRI